MQVCAVCAYLPCCMCCMRTLTMLYVLYMLHSDRHVVGCMRIHALLVCAACVCALTDDKHTQKSTHARMWSSFSVLTAVPCAVPNCCCETKAPPPPLCYRVDRAAPRNCFTIAVRELLLYCTSGQAQQHRFEGTARYQFFYSRIILFFRSCTRIVL